MNSLGFLSLSLRSANTLPSSQDLLGIPSSQGLATWGSDASQPPWVSATGSDKLRSPSHHVQRQNQFRRSSLSKEQQSFEEQSQRHGLPQKGLLKSSVTLGEPMQEIKAAESGPEGRGRPATR